MKRLLIGTLAALLLSGCAMLNEVPLVGDLPFVHPSLTGGEAVILGLTRVDPAAYGGWNGACPGCDVDARIMADLARENGLHVTLLMNSEATIERSIAAVRMAADRVPAGGLLMIYISGHGGQVRDTSGDEVDRLDETLCLWDGQLNDDVLGFLWTQLPPTIRVAYITDTCNSGTNYKRPHDLGASIPRGSVVPVIHIGGCADGLSSFGSSQGGYMTTALIDGWDDDRSWLEWAGAAQGHMPEGQVLVYAEHGPVTDAFRHGRAMR